MGLPVCHRYLLSGCKEIFNKYNYPSFKIEEITSNVTYLSLLTNIISICCPDQINKRTAGDNSYIIKISSCVVSLTVAIVVAIVTWQAIAAS